MELNKITLFLVWIYQYVYSIAIKRMGIGIETWDMISDLNNEIVRQFIW